MHRSQREGPSAERSAEGHPEAAGRRNWHARSTTPKEFVMKTVIRLLALSVMSVVLLGAAIACNTTEGAGKDIEKAGDGIKDAARDAKD